MVERYLDQNCPPRIQGSDVNTSELSDLPCAQLSGAPVCRGVPPWAPFFRVGCDDAPPTGGRPSKLGTHLNYFLLAVSFLFCASRSTSGSCPLFSKTNTSRGHALFSCTAVGS